MTFTPPSQGTFNASINISYNGPGSPLIVPLSGNTLPVPDRQLSPSSVSFPTQYVGASGLPQTVTFTNPAGNGMISISKRRRDTHHRLCSRELLRE